MPQNLEEKKAAIQALFDEMAEYCGQQDLTNVYTALEPIQRDVEASEWSNIRVLFKAARRETHTLPEDSVARKFLSSKLQDYDDAISVLMRTTLGERHFAF